MACIFPGDMAEAEFTKVPKEEVLRFCQSCMEVAGASASHGKQLGEILMTADYRGHFSHGMNRLRMCTFHSSVVGCRCLICYGRGTVFCGVSPVLFHC